MKVTRILYFLASYNVLWSVIQAIQPEGYLGCFEDSYGDSLVDSSKDSQNIGEGTLCKSLCKTHNKRYAGTKRLWCYCGSDVVQNKKTHSTECNTNCPQNQSEICGGNNGTFYHRISLYDTWLCITSPCKNGATCTAIDADNFNCSCRAGWTGRVCNETVTTTTSRISRSSSTQAIRSTTTIQTVTTTTTTIFPSFSTQSSKSSTAAQPVSVTNTTNSISPSSSRQGIGSSTVVAPREGNKLAIYIAVPVSIVVMIVFVLIVTVLILRKKLNQKKDDLKVVYRNTAKAGHSLHAVANNAYNDNDIIPLETLVNVNATNDFKEDAATGDSDHNYYTLEQTEDGNCKFNNVDQSGGSAIQNDDSGYGHLHVRSTALCDPTYSHTTTTGSQGNTDYTFSHLNQPVGNKGHEIMSNVDQDTYNTVKMKGDVGKLRPAVEINYVDDTYNRLAISGKATNMGEKQTVSSLNEPDYDHTDVRKH